MVLTAQQILSFFVIISYTFYFLSLFLQEHYKGICIHILQQKDHHLSWCVHLQNNLILGA